MKGTWGLILGASSGFGLATAKKMAREGMNLVLVHRDRRSKFDEINKNFDEINELTESIFIFNQDALNSEKRAFILDEIKERVEPVGISLLLHSIAKGNLKQITHMKSSIATSESELEHEFKKINQHQSEVDFGSGRLEELDFTLTNQAMATSLLSWTYALHDLGMFAKTARIIGLTSEGDKKIWPGYGAVAVAKSNLETLAKYMAVEFAGSGLRTNIIQAGITKTPSMEMIPGSDLMTASAKYRNPMGRLTTTSDVANVVYLLCRPEADWINGTRIIVDGGEHLV